MKLGFTIIVFCIFQHPSQAAPPQDFNWNQIFGEFRGIFDTQIKWLSSKVNMKNYNNLLRKIGDIAFIYPKSADRARWTARIDTGHSTSKIIHGHTPDLSWDSYKKFLSKVGELVFVYPDESEEMSDNWRKRKLT